MKVGVLGLGSIGLRHAKNLMQMGYDTIAFDPSQERRSTYEAEGGSCSEKENILSGCDAVVVASPSQYHLTDLTDAIGHQRHVFVEKPLAHTMDGFPAVAESTTKQNLSVALGMNMRFNPAVLHLSELLKSGKLGDILWANYWHSSFLPDWRPGVDHTKGYAADPKTGGVIFDVIHGFDLVQFLLGNYDVKGAVARNSGTLGISSEDCADIQCLHASGPVSTLHMDFMTRPKTHTVTVAGTKGIARVDITGRRTVLTGIDNVVIEDCIYADTTVNDDYCAELKDFLDSVSGKPLRGCSLDQGIVVLEQVLKARKLAGLPHD